MQDSERIIEMACEDRTPFEAIRMQFNLSEAGVIKLMRKEPRRSSFKLWRRRVNCAVSQNHLRIRNPAFNKFRSAMQRTIFLNKISNR